MAGIPTRDPSAIDRPGAADPGDWFGRSEGEIGPRRPRVRAAFVARAAETWSSRPPGCSDRRIVRRPPPPPPPPPPPQPPTPPPPPPPAKLDDLRAPSLPPLHPHRTVARDVRPLTRNDIDVERPFHTRDGLPR